MTDAVLRVAVDPTGAEQGGRVVRRTLEDIANSARDGMSAVDRYNSTLGAGATAADIFRRQMQAIQAQMRAAEQAVQAQNRAVNDLSVRFDVLRERAKNAVASLQDFGRTKFSGDLASQIDRLSSSMAAAIDQGGRRAVSAARASQREMLDIIKADLRQQEDAVKQAAARKIAGAEEEYRRIADLHKGAKTEIAEQERKAASEALALIKKTAAEEIAAQEAATKSMVADFKRRTDEIINLKRRENTAQAEYERGNAALARSNENLLRSQKQLDDLHARSSQAQFNGALGVSPGASKSAAESAAVFEENERKMALLATRASALKESLDPAAKAQRLFAESVADTDELLAHGLITQQQHVSAVTRYRENMLKASSSNDNAAHSTKLAAHEVTNLTYQLQDAAVQLAGGQNPLLILMQQGPQATGAVGGLGRAMQLLLTPIGIAVLAIGLFVAAAAGVIGLRESYASSVREMTNANRLMGNTLGATAGQMEALAETAAEAGDVSVKAARSMVAEYNRVGAIGGSTIQSLIGITRDYAVLTGQDAVSATAELAGIMKDPARGAAELADRYNLLSGAMLDHVRRLQETGNKTEAQRVLTEALTQRVKGAADDTSVWARAWDWVARAASNAGDSMGRAIDRAVKGPSLDERLSAAQASLTKLREMKQEEDALGSRDKSWQPGQSIGEPMRPRPSVSPELAQAEQEVERLRELARERNRGAAMQGIAANNNAASRAALDVAQKYDDLGATLRKAEGDLATLQKGLGPGMGSAAAQGGRTVEALKNQIADLTQVQASGLDLATFKSRELAKVEQQAAGMVGPAREQYLVQERTRIALLGTATTVAQRSAQAQTAVAQANAGIATSTADATRELSLQVAAQDRLAAAAGQGEAAQRRATIENAVAAASLKGLGQATREALEAQEAATVRQIRGDQTQPILDQIRAQEALAAAYAQGAPAVQAAELASKAHAMALREGAVGTDQFNKAYAHYLDLLHKGTSADFGASIAKFNDQIDEQRKKLEVRAQMLGATDQQKSAIQVQADIDSWLKSQNKTYESLTAAERQRVDNARNAAIANADLELSIQRQEDAMKAVADTLERAFERVGDAIVDAFVAGKGEGVSFGSVMKGVIASIASDMVKLAFINPMRNAVFGGGSPSLWNAFGSNANQNAANQSGMGGVGDYLSLGAKFIPSSWMNGALNGAASALGIGGASIAAQGAAASTIAEVAAADVMAAWGAGGSGIAAGSGAGAGAASTLAAGAGDAAMAAGGGLTAGGSALASVLGPAAAGFGIGMLPGMFGANKVVSAGIGAAGGAGVGFLIGGPVGALIGGGAGLLGGIFGGQTKPSNREGNVSIDFAAGTTTVGGQEGKKYSAENRQAAQGIGSQIQQLAATLEALLPGQQIKGQGLIAVGDRDGLRAEYAGQTAKFGKEDTAGLAAWFATQFAADMKSGFERGDLPAQVADNLQIVLDRGVTSGVEQFVADLQLASTDFSKLFDEVGKAQPDQVAAAVKQASDQFIAMRDSATALTLGIEGMAESVGGAFDRIIDSGIRAAKGLSAIDSALAIGETFTKTATALVVAGQDPAKAIKLYEAQMGALVNSLDPKALDEMAKALKGVDDVAVAFASERKRQLEQAARDTYEVDAAARVRAAQVTLGQITQDEADRLNLEAQHVAELVDVTDPLLRARKLEVHEMEDQALAAEQAAKATAELAEKQKALISAGASIRSWIDQQRSTAGVGVTPGDALANAKAQFGEDLALARGGNVDALARITGTAERLMAAQEAMTASGKETQAMRTWVLSSLETLPATKSYDQLLLEEIQKLGGSVKVDVELATFRVITEQLNALSDDDRKKLTQTQTVLRTVEEKLGTLLSGDDLASLMTAEVVRRDVEQSLKRSLTDEEMGKLAGAGDVIRDVQEVLKKTLTAAEVASLIAGGDITRSVAEKLGVTLTSDQVAKLVLGGDVTRTVGEVMGAALTSEQVSALVKGGAVDRTITQTIGRDLTAEERAGLVVAMTVGRSVEQSLGRVLTAAEWAQIILPGSVQRVIGQQIDPATGSPLVPGGTVTRTVAQTVETTETVQISRSIDDKLSGILGSINQGIQNNLVQLNAIGTLLHANGTYEVNTMYNTATVAERLGGVGLRAAGGPVEAGRSYIVGEFGPEKVTFGAAGYVYPTGVEPPANDRWASNIAPIRRQDYAPTPGRSGSDDRTAAELRLLRQAVERLTRLLERNEGMDQEQRAKIAQQHADLLDRIAAATEGAEKRLTGTGGF
ncbi:phage tail length tape measure family protein [Azospirillum himalayense]|uniref:Phage tail length tape measure family protein n=1 Tax=Azospirillum himalayense TaxID=654847 RepID=A0ABW0GBB4_9PROT